MNIKAMRETYDCRDVIPADIGANHRGPKYACPFGTHTDNNPSFVVYKDGYRCFTCGESGDIFDWWAFWRNQPLSDVLRGEGIDPAEEQKRKEEIARKRADYDRREKAAILQALEELRETAPHIKAYEFMGNNRSRFHDAGFEDWYIDRMKFGLSLNTWWAAGDKFQCVSMTIPCYNLDGMLCGMQYRLLDVDESVGKYRNRPTLRNSDPELDFRYPSPLFMANFGEHVVTEPVYLLEGAKKAAVFFQTLAVKSAWVVGLTTKTLSNVQAKQLKPAQSVYFIPDPDVSEDEIQKTVDKLPGKKVWLVETVQKMDDAIIENNLTKNDVRNIISSARRIK